MRNYLGFLDSAHWKGSQPLSVFIFYNFFLSVFNGATSWSYLSRALLLGRDVVGG